jgi:DNA-directed RNA polymerase subunit RPC12/RpoP
MDFTDYVEGFGFDYNFGSYSDICEFCPAWGIAGVNLSIGYLNEHSVSETLFIGQMLSTIEKVKHMLDDAKNLIEPFIYIASPFFHGAWYGNSSGMYNREVHKCNKCRRYFMGEELFYTMQQDKTLRLRCSECLADDAVNWCMKCGTPYEKSAQDEGVCPRCKELKEKRENGITKPNK